MRKFTLGPLLALSLGLAAVTAPAATAEGADKAEIEKIVREYLLANPEILVEVQDALTAKREKQEKVARDKAIAASGAAIFASTADAVIGNPKGDVTVVEFYDYNCGYCKRALNDMDAMVKADPNLRFVLKEYPILGEDSLKAHVVAQAFKKLMPDKYGDFHRTLLTGERATEDSAIAVAVLLGANEV